MTNELTDKEKCLVIQMMLRQSPRLKNVPNGIKESIQLFFKTEVYPNLTPQNISEFNLELDKFLHDSEARLQKGLIKAVGKNAFDGILKKFNIGKKADNDEGISQDLIRELEEKVRSEVNKDDGT